LFAGMALLDPFAYRFRSCRAIPKIAMALSQLDAVVPDREKE
jgi:hypothetical protein